MKRAYRYELQPIPAQEVMMSQFFGNVRFVYNWALGQRIEQYEQTGKTTSKYAQMRSLTKLKRNSDYIWLNESPVHSLQKAVDQVDAAFVNFFEKRADFPTFKKKGKCKESFQIPDRKHIQFDWDKCIVKLPKVKGVRFYRDRPIVGQIRRATVTRTPTGRYYLSVIVEDGITVAPLMPVEAEMVGIDMGLKTYAVFSDGTEVENPRLLKQKLERLKKLQRKQSRKISGSRRHTRGKRRIASLHEKVSNQRKDFQHKTSTAIAKRWRWVAMEDLNIKGMIKNHRLARHIQDAGWYGFKEKLRHKMGAQGGCVVDIGRFEPSSKLCSVCGYVHRGLQLSDRHWQCPSCRTQHDRDRNAAINIKKFGWIQLGAKGSTSRVKKARARGRS